MITHTEKIKCPDCGTIQDAIVEHTIPFHTYLHNCEKCNFTIMESDWEVVKTTQQTAMQILRAELEDRMNRAVFANEFNAYKNIYNLIDTELLAIEKQQIIDFANKMQLVRDVNEDGDVLFAFDPENKFNQTFNPK